MQSTDGASSSKGFLRVAGASHAQAIRPALPSLRLPFVNTAPLTDLHLLIGLSPVFWLFGIEQFVALPLLFWSVLKYFLQGKGLKVGLPTTLLLAMIFIMLLSATSIDSGMRSLTFVRTTSMYVMGLFVAILIAGECNTPAKTRGLLRTLVLMMGLVGALSLLGVLGVADIRFRSLAGYLLPGALAETGYGNQIVWRFLGNESWFQGFGSYFRVSGIFLFSTMCAAATAITMPIAIYFVASSHGRLRSFYGIVAGLILVPLVFSTGRVAWLAITVAGLVIGMLALKLMPRVLALLLASAAVAALFVVMPPGFVADAIDDTVYARGAGSTTSRMTIYRATFEGFMERPLLGWGTERDITSLENFDLPAGSHSQYLGFVFKHGILGITALLTFIGVVVWQIWSALAKRRSGKADQIATLLSFVSWSLLTAALIGLTSALDLDATLALIVWVVLFSGLRLGTFLRSSPHQSVRAASEASMAG